MDNIPDAITGSATPGFGSANGPARSVPVEWAGPAKHKWNKPLSAMVRAGARRIGLAKVTYFVSGEPERDIIVGGCALAMAYVGATGSVAFPFREKGPAKEWLDFRRAVKGAVKDKAALAPCRDLEEAIVKWVDEDGLDAEGVARRLEEMGL